MKFQTTSLLVLGCSMALFLNGCTCNRNQSEDESNTQTAAPEATPEPFAAPDYSKITVNRVLTTDLETGTGAVVKDGSKITGEYGMWVYAPAQIGNKGRRVGGTEGDETYTFTVGKGEVIKGFEQGVIGMKVGGKRSMVIPIELAYGEKGTDEVPPGSIILVEFELTDVE